MYFAYFLVVFKVFDVFFSELSESFKFEVNSKSVELRPILSKLFSQIFQIEFSLLNPLVRRNYLEIRIFNSSKNIIFLQLSGRLTTGRGNA